MASMEEKVEEYFKVQLNKLKIRHYSKTEKINSSIEEALKKANSKSGNIGNNYPDIKTSSAKQDTAWYTGHDRSQRFKRETGKIQ